MRKTDLICVTFDIFPFQRKLLDYMIANEGQLNPRKYIDEKEISPPTLRASLKSLYDKGLIVKEYLFIPENLNYVDVRLWRKTHHVKRYRKNKGSLIFKLNLPVLNEAIAWKIFELEKYYRSIQNAKEKK